MLTENSTINLKSDPTIKERLITIRVRDGEYDVGTGLATYVAAHGGQSIVVPIDAIEDIRSVAIGREFAQ